MAKVIQSADFIWAAVDGNYPTHRLPEVCFTGRSNVGKSSLINSIVMRKNLAHTSSKPGKTQSINFFNIEDKWALVDMPGFGYAQKGKQFQEYWKKENVKFMLTRENIRFVCVLIDSRVPLQKIDLELIESLENGSREYLIIVTKTDKISRKETEDKLTEIGFIVSQCKFCIDTIPYSSYTNVGREILLSIIKRKISNKQ
jgi:GTP-binding protein